MEQKLVEYGILQEQSDIRAHVSVVTKTVFVFKTEEVKKILPGKYRLVGASQPGISVKTAEGWLVPVGDIPDIRQIKCNNYSWWDRFSDSDSTSEKGKKATKVVVFLLRKGQIPLWLSVREPEEKDIQISGVDIIITKNLRIQVKCDWRSGPKELGGSGNLFIQKAEINPRKLI
jgi:hypothetical protein